MQLDAKSHSLVPGAPEVLSVSQHLSSYFSLDETYWVKERENKAGDQRINFFFTDIFRRAMKFCLQMSFIILTVV